MKKLIQITASSFIIFASAASYAAPAQKTDTHSAAPVVTDMTVSESLAQQRATMEKREAQDFQKYIASIKNNPAASQLPADAQQRRTQMIQQIEKQHALMLKNRKQHQAEFDAERARQQSADKI